MVRLFSVNSLILISSLVVSLAHAEDSTHTSRPVGDTSPRPAAEARKGFTEDEYMSTVVEEYKSCTNNYDDANDFCYVRAAKLADKYVEMANRLNVDPKGADGTWGTDDDMIKKVVVRFPSGHKWWYHIATVVRDEEGDMVVCDPIDGDLEIRTPLEWAEYYGDGFKVCNNSIGSSPNKGECHYEVKPIFQWSPTTKYSSLREISDAVKNVQGRLDSRIKSLDNTDTPAYPKLDSDKDGIPDKIDECEGTAAGTKVDYTGC